MPDQDPTLAAIDAAIAARGGNSPGNAGNGAGNASPSGGDATLAAIDAAIARAQSRGGRGGSGGGSGGSLPPTFTDRGVIPGPTPLRPPAVQRGPVAPVPGLPFGGFVSHAQGGPQGSPPTAGQPPQTLGLITQPPGAMRTGPAPNLSLEQRFDNWVNTGIQNVVEGIHNYIGYENSPAANTLPGLPGVHPGKVVAGVLSLPDYARGLTETAAGAAVPGPPGQPYRQALPGALASVPEGLTANLLGSEGTIKAAVKAYQGGDTATATRLLASVPGVIGQYARENKLETALTLLPLAHMGLSAGVRGVGTLAASGAEGAARVAAQSGEAAASAAVGGDLAGNAFHANAADLHLRTAQRLQGIARAAGNARPLDVPPANGAAPRGLLPPLNPSYPDTAVPGMDSGLQAGKPTTLPMPGRPPMPVSRPFLATEPKAGAGPVIPLKPASAPPPMPQRSGPLDPRAAAVPPAPNTSVLPAGGPQEAPPVAGAGPESPGPSAAPQSGPPQSAPPQSAPPQSAPPLPVQWQPHPDPAGLASVPKAAQDLLRNNLVLHPETEGGAPAGHFAQLTPAQEGVLGKAGLLRQVPTPNGGRINWASDKALALFSPSVPDAHPESILTAPPIEAPAAAPVAPSVEAGPSVTPSRPAPDAPPTPPAAAAAPVGENPATRTAPAEAAPATPKAAPLMAGSNQLGHFDATPEGRGRIADAAEAAGLNGKPPVTFDQTRAAAEALGLNADALRDLPPGTLPPGMTVDRLPGWQFGLRSLVRHHADVALPAAERAFNERPTPETKAALDRANLDHLHALRHADALSNAGSHILNQQRMDAAAFAGHAEGDLYAPRPDVPPARSPGFGANNRFFTRARADAARQRILAAGRRLNSGIDPALLPDLVHVGGYYLEGGLNRFGDWARQMGQDFGQRFSPGDWQTVWAHVRAEAAQRQARAGAARPASSVFVDQIAHRLGREGAAGFVRDVTGPNGETDLLDKIIAGTPRTEAEERRVARAYLDNSPGRSKGTPASGAIREVLEAAGQMRREQARATRTQAPLTPEKALMGHVARRLTAPGAQQFRQALTDDQWGKLVRGEALAPGDREAVGRAWVSAKPSAAPPKALTGAQEHLSAIAQEAQLRARHEQDFAQARADLASMTPKEMVRRQLLRVVDPHDAARVSAIGQDLAAVGDHDGPALADVLARHTPHTFWSNAASMVKSGMLSSVETLKAITMSHLLYMAAEEAKRGVAAPLSRGTRQGASLPAVGRAAVAGMRAVPRAGHILAHGEASLTLSGRNPVHLPGEALRPEFNLSTRMARSKHAPARFANRAINAAFRLPPRVHSALFHVLGSAAYDRGISEAAALTARGEAKLRGLSRADARAYERRRAQDLRQRPTPAMEEHAIRFAQHQTFTNPNKADEIVKDVVRKADAAAPGVGTAVQTVVSPFSHVPSNVAAKGGEYTLGALLKPRVLAKYLTGKPLTQEETGHLADTIGRGAVGVPLMAAAAYLAKNGLLDAPDPKTHTEGRLHVMGRDLTLRHLAPVSTGPMAAASAVQQMGPDGTGDFGKPLAVMLGDQPLLRAGGTLGQIGAGDAGRVAGNTLGSLLVPGLLADAARWQDQGTPRERSTPLDYLKYRLPYLRGTLPPR